VSVVQHYQAKAHQSVVGLVVSVVDQPAQALLVQRALGLVVKATVTHLKTALLPPRLWDRLVA
jgi:hypothetical protein